MLSKAEMKDIRERANGKPFLFRPRHHWIYDWIAAQAGRSLPDKLYGIVERAYKADCLERGRAAMCRFYTLTDQQDVRATVLLTELNEAIEMFSSAGEQQRTEDVRAYLRGVLAQLASGKRAA